MFRGVMFQYFEWNCKADGSLWTELSANAADLKKIGVSAVWIPPAYKALGGANDTGYATYDLYDLGEFEQKGSVRTKYGTREQLLGAVDKLQQQHIEVYGDTVLNHRMGGDEIEEVEIVEVCCENRNIVEGEPYKIRAYAGYTFPGRGERYSTFKPHAEHFNAFGFDANQPEEKGKIYRLKDKSFSGEVDFEFGNFDYLMGADVDHYHPDVKADLMRWGEWFIQTTKLNGFRLDAVKHIPASFYVDWLREMRAKFPERKLFAVGEYWTGSFEEINKYLIATDGAMHLFDVPLHFRFSEASQKGKAYDLRQIFDNTLVRHNPLLTVTFVENHDSQPGQALQSPVLDWFKPLAYALILLRNDGYPCLFYGDYYGNDREGTKLLSHRKLLDDFLLARQTFMYGEQRDYLDHPTCIGWAWTGDDEHPRAMAVLMSTADEGHKRMNAARPGQKFHDVTGHIPHQIVADANGEADFICPAGKISVWCGE